MPPSLHLPVRHPRSPYTKKTSLAQGGADGGFDWDLWETLDGAKAAQNYLVECEAAERKERSKRQAAATRAANKAKVAGEKDGGKAAATPRVTAKRAGDAPGRKAGATTAKKVSCLLVCSWTGWSYCACLAVWLFICCRHHPCACHTTQATPSTSL